MGKMINVIKVTTEDVITKVQIDTDKVAEELNAELFEIISRTAIKPQHKIVMVIDESGKIKEKPLNAIGTYIYENAPETIVGDLFFIKEVNGPEGPEFGDFKDADSFIKSLEGIKPKALRIKEIISGMPKGLDDLFKMLGLDSNESEDEGEGHTHRCASCPIAQECDLPQAVEYRASLIVPTDTTPAEQLN